MADFDPAALEAELVRILPRDARHLIVGFSGGLDSTVLLTALARIVALNSRWQLSALHVDHQLHPESSAWAAYCAEVAARLHVPFAAVRIAVDLQSGDGLEATARRARYAALAPRVGRGGVLLTAHHADDQLETMLLALARSAGVAGLSAMPACAAFADGLHARPVLAWTRGQMAAWAQLEGIAGLEDPSNVDRRRDRNFLRLEILPALRERWPSIALSAVRSAAHLGSAQRLLDELAIGDEAVAAVDRCLDVDALCNLTAERRGNVLRHWLRGQGARAPSTRQLDALLHDMLQAQADRCPAVTLPDGFSVHRHRGLLYCESPVVAAPQADFSLEWDWRRALELPAGLGSLCLLGDSADSARSSVLPPTISVRFRDGGERLKIAGHAHHQRVKHLLQERGVLPWWRKKVPLLWAGDELLAVADLWIGERLAALRATSNAPPLAWRERPNLFAIERKKKSRN